MNFSYLRLLTNCAKYVSWPRSHLTLNQNTSVQVPVFSCKVFLSNDQSKESSEEKRKNVSWRQPFHQRDGEWYSAFSLFAPKKGSSPDVIRFLQSPIDFRPSKIREWWRRKREERAIFDQRFITERHEILGNDLAAAHFIVHRGGAVKFLGQSNWVKQNEDQEYELPRTYRTDFIVEAIDASNVDIYYEGFANMVNLKKLTWLSLSGCKHIDDWCVDRISGEYQSTLEYLDLSDCQQITERALSPMYRLRKLRTLKLNNIVKSKSFELACLMLEDINPNLSIEGVTYMDIPVVQKEGDGK